MDGRSTGSLAGIMKRSWFFLGLLVLLALCPIRSVTVPEWRVRFLDAKGNPLANLPVRQTWRNYSLEEAAHYALGSTDLSGSVIFPARALWYPLGARLLWPLRHLGSIHASYGPSSWLVPLCDVLEKGPRLATYTGGDLPNQIALSYFDRSNIRAKVPGMSSPALQCAELEAQVRNAG
jgi:hypothetical protein